MRLFERHIAIDWSGAGHDAKRNRGLAIACDGEVIAPPKFTTWSRLEVLDYLRRVLRPEEPRSLVAIDAALSFPWGFAQTVFEAANWREMVDGFGALSHDHDTARAIAQTINARFDSGPFRFNDSRNDPRFYRQFDVPYFRAVELLMPQCISPFYLGSGATVGFHAITALCALSKLLARRDDGELDFTVWPFESAEATSRHLVCECYPAMFPKFEADTLSEHERDAMRVVAWTRATSDAQLRTALTPGEPGFVRGDVPWPEQLAFEGWVLGV